MVEASLDNPMPVWATATFSEASHYRARYYDQNAGQFSSEDSIRFKAGINFFSCVFNDPINLIDPKGYAACCASKEEPDIRKRINGVRNFLDQLDATGTIAITGTVSPLAETFCQGFKIRGHEDIKLPSQAKQFSSTRPSRLEVVA